MNVVHHKTVQEFLDRAGPWLAEAEAENCLILGACSALVAHPERYKTDPRLMTVEQKGSVVGAALITPPQNLVVTPSPDAAMAVLAEYLLKAGVPLPGVIGPSTEAESFASYWAERTTKLCRLKMTLRIYQCDRVVAAARGPGGLRAAVDTDVPLLIEWRREFFREIGLDDHDDPRVAVQERVAGRKLYVWEHDRPVSTAAREAETPDGVRLGFVYTPPALRRSGYATSCVAELTRLLLDGGKAYCFLNADLANPTSNGIYETVGYRPVCDSQIWRFD